MTIASFETTCKTAYISSPESSQEALLDTFLEAEEAFTASPAAFELDETCLDALREVGNIGLGNAMTALATMLDQSVDMAVPHVEWIPLSEFSALVGGEQAVSACIYMPVDAIAPGHVAFFLPEVCAHRLIDQLMGLGGGTTQELDEMGCSALMEIGNILASAYLVAISDMTGLQLCASPPALALDMTAAILTSIATVFAATQDQALTMMTRVGTPGTDLEGFFLYVPEPKSLPVLLGALGMADLLPTPCGEGEKPL